MEIPSVTDWAWAGVIAENLAAADHSLLWDVTEERWIIIANMDRQGTETASGCDLGDLWRQEPPVWDPENTFDREVYGLCHGWIPCDLCSMLVDPALAFDVQDATGAVTRYCQDCGDQL